MQSLKPYPPSRRFWTSSLEKGGSLVRQSVARQKMTWLTMPFLTLSLVLVSGCVGVKLNNSERLTEHPGFRKAALASPEFVKEALKTVNRLEYELERK